MLLRTEVLSTTDAECFRNWAPNVSGMLSARIHASQEYLSPYSILQLTPRRFLKEPQGKRHRAEDFYAVKQAWHT